MRSRSHSPAWPLVPGTRSQSPAWSLAAERSPWWVLAAILLVFLGLFLATADYALIDPDEGRNAEVAREIASSGEFLVPSINDLPFLDKPFLYPATGAISIKLFGTSERAVRLPSLFFAFATTLLTAWFAARLFGRRAALVAGVAWLTAPLTVAYSYTVIFDTALTFFIVLALIAFYLAVESYRDPTRGSATPWTVLAWLSMALGLLTKGPVALVVPLLVAVPFAIWRRASRAVWHPAGWVSHLLIVVPWALVVESRVPGFLSYALVTESWRRLTTDEMNRTGPVWYFLPYLLGGSLPWSLVALLGARRRWRQARRDRPTFSDERKAPLVFLLLWLVLPLVFFSFSHSKRPHYILPLIPAVVLLTAWIWTGKIDLRRGIRGAAIGWGLLAVLLLAAGAGLVPISVGAELQPLVTSTASTLGLLTLAGGLLAWLSARRKPVALLALALPPLLLPLAVSPLMHEIARERSGKELASAIRPHLTDDTTVLGIETYSPSLTFYLGQPTLVASTTGEPLPSNFIPRLYEDLSDPVDSTLRPREQWWQRLDDPSRSTIFLLETHYRSERAVLEAAGLSPLFENRKIVAMGPREPRAEGDGLAPPSTPAAPATSVGARGLAHP